RGAGRPPGDQAGRPPRGVRPDEDLDRPGAGLRGPAGVPGGPRGGGRRDRDGPRKARRTECGQPRDRRSGHRTASPDGRCRLRQVCLCVSPGRRCGSADGGDRAAQSPQAAPGRTGIADHADPGALRRRREPSRIDRMLHVARPRLPTPEARERYAREFYWLLEGFRFIPGGRIMHAVGNPKRVTNLNCFPPGTRVLTRAGFKTIEEVRVGDEVLTHRNRFRNVTHTMHRETVEPLRTMRLWYLGDRQITTTKEHRFMAFDGSRADWVEAQHLTPSHYVKVGRIDETLPVSELDLSEYVSAAAVEDEVGKLYTVTAFIGGQGARRSAESKRIARTVPVDERFGLWLGYFMAEGGVTDNSVYFTFNKNEEAYAEAICNLTQQLFGVEAAIQRREGQEGH